MQAMIQNPFSTKHIVVIRSHFPYEICHILPRRFLFLLAALSAITHTAYEFGGGGGGGVSNRKWKNDRRIIN